MTDMSTLLWLVLLQTTVHAVDYNDCNSKYHLESVYISDCNAAPCKIVVGTNINVTTSFTPKSDATLLTNTVYFSLNNARINAVVQPEPCVSLACPLRSSQQAYTYSSLVSVPSSLPALGGELAWSLQDDKNVTVICFRVEIQLAPPNSSSSTYLSQHSPVADSAGVDDSLSPQSPGQHVPAGQHDPLGAQHHIPAKVSH